MPLTRREALVVMAYTGISTVSFGDFHRFAEKTLGRPVWTHEFASQIVTDELKAATKDEFLALCATIPKEPEDWEFEDQDFSDEAKSEGLRSMIDNLPDTPIVLVADDVELPIVPKDRL